MHMLRRLFRPIMPNTNSFGLNLQKKTSLNSKQKEMYFHIRGTLYNIYRVDRKK